MKILLLLIFLLDIAESMLFIGQSKQVQKIVSKSLLKSVINDVAFDINAAFVEIVNSLPGNKFKLGLNEFADLTFEEFQNQYLKIVMPKNRGNQVTYASSDPQLTEDTQSYEATDEPAEVDNRNYSLAVKHQRNCGSCWAFAAISTLESRLKFLDPTFNTTLSEQYLVDCDTRNYGCSGGWPVTAMNWILQQGGNAVPTSKSYPYYGFRTKCRSTSKLTMNINAIIQNATAGNEEALKEIVDRVGAVSVVVSITKYFQLYESGIFYDSTCNSDCSSVNHAVVVVGYGTDPDTNFDYWIVKNFWGTGWGEQGYIYMSRNKGNNCNIACWAMYAL